ncbi:hypothetical protein [Gaoshiqia sediminis]|uniref:Uncharacterized protein n=1 Tax=Gaoshiqia sediminis TaxID=2986998 RepID=A0AA42C819_9BACT|nr:hypothetical protein [Gaoshiqia sediminis]MCW0484174.1 hypothetical protein [Gaoshiqia sediminis]
METEDIIDVIRRWENLDLFKQHLIHHPDQLQLLFRVAFDDSNPVYWRAAYLIDQLSEQNPALIRPYVPQLVKALSATSNTSKLRHYLKVVSQYPISEDSIDFLFGFCLDVFTKPSYPVAVRVHAMKILYHIAEMEPGLKPELIQIIEYELTLHPTAGLKSRGRHLLAKLRR